MAFLSTRFVVSCVCFAAAVVCVVSSEGPSDSELEDALKILLSPEESSIQVQALRRGILRKLQEALDRADEEGEGSFKPSASALVAWNNYLDQKRNLEALARSGYLKTSPIEDDAESYKRSIAALAKNGQLPLQNEGRKRGLEALARNGDLHPKKDIRQMIDDLYYKRNIGSLARNYDFPNYGKRSLSSLAKAGDLNSRRFQYKRNIASLARGGQFTGKRNVGALLRQDEYLNNLRKQDPDNSDDRDEKRSLASIKAQYKPKYKRSIDEATDRDKRDADYYYQENSEYPASVYQGQNVYDYDDLMQDFNGVYPNNEKRFLGRLPQMGKPRTTPSPKSRRYQ